MIGIASQRRNPLRVVVDDDDDDERRHGDATSVAGNDDDDEIHDSRAVWDLDARPTAEDAVDDAAEKDPAPTEETAAALSSYTTEDASGELARTKKEQSSGSARDHVGRRAGEPNSPTERSRPGKSESGEPSKPPPPREPRREQKQKNPPPKPRKSGRDGHDDGHDDGGGDYDEDLPDMTGKIITVDLNVVAGKQRRRRPSRKERPDGHGNGADDVDDENDGRLPDFTGKFIVVERPLGGPDDRDQHDHHSSDDKTPPAADIDLDDLITQERESLSRGASHRSIWTNPSRSRSWRTHRSSNAGGGTTSVKSSFTTSAANNNYNNNNNNNSHNAAATASRIESWLKGSSQTHHRNSQRSILSHRTGDSESGTAVRSIATGGAASNAASAAASAAGGLYAHMKRRSSLQSFTPGEWIDERTNEESSQETTAAGDNEKGDELQTTAMNAISEGNALCDKSHNSNNHDNENNDSDDDDNREAEPSRPFLRLNPLDKLKHLSQSTTFQTTTTSSHADLSTSLHTRDSHRSKKSHRSQTTHRTNTDNADDDSLRSQSTFQFRRGCHYAEREDYTKSRQKFLTALRYTVRDAGPAHPRVALIHECLGRVEFFRLEEQVRERQRLALDDWGMFLERTKGGDGVDDSNSDSSTMAGDGRRKQTKDTNFGEASAMHFRTALDILGASDVASAAISADSAEHEKLNVVAENRDLSAMSISDRTFDNSGLITMEELDQLLFGQGKVNGKITPLQLADMADLYSALTKDDGGEDDESSNPHHGREHIRAEIIRRITNVLDFLVHEYGVPSVGNSFASAASFLKMYP